MYMTLERMMTARQKVKSRIESGCVDLPIAPANIWMPAEYLPNLKTRKTRISRITRRKPRPEPSPSGLKILAIAVTQNGKNASRSMMF